jgi:enediyne biosynthesis protein E4
MRGAKGSVLGCLLMAGLLSMFVYGIYLLSASQETFLPYLPTTPVSFVLIEDSESPATLFTFDEAQAEAARLRAVADEHLAGLRYAEAIEILKQALQMYSFLDGLYERLDVAFMASGRFGEALQAMEAVHERDASIVFTTHGLKADVRGIPDVLEVTQERGLDSCKHVRKDDIDLGAPGIAVADLTGDGHLEIICLGGYGRPTRIYRLERSRFVQAVGTGVEETLRSQGVYTVDLTHNGLPDIVVTAIGESRVYLNQGNLRFRAMALPLPEMWGSALAAGDFTGNGNVDLVVGGWIGAGVWKVDEASEESSFRTYEDNSDEASERRRSPNPDAALHLLNVRVRYGVPLRLLEGDGAGGFSDITLRSGVNVEATTLNLELIDVDQDGNLDLVIINDGMPARLFLGSGQGAFHDVTHQARFADLRAGMGLAVADFDRNGHWDFVKTHFQGEMNGVFINDGHPDGVPRYRDASLESGLGVPSLPYVGWAAFAWDFDADGDEDLLIVNGHMRETPQPVQLFRNRGGSFADVSGALPHPLKEPMRGRGAALFDLTGNGYDDLLVTQNNGGVRLFEMRPRHDNRWLRVRLRVPDVDALGGVVELLDSQGRIQKRPVRTGSAFFSSQPRDYFFGLSAAKPATLIWKGRQSAFRCTDLAADTIVTITKAGCTNDSGARN